MEKIVKLDKIRSKRHAIVLGATGATGRELVKILLKNSNFNKISVFVRREIDFEHKKLIVNKIDFSRLEKYKSLCTGDILFSALGTTRKDAKSKSQQYLVDYTYQYKFAKMALENGVSHYSLVSSVGANHKSLFFYPKIKGALEKSIKKLPFNKIQIFQPPLLIRQDDIMRKGERISGKILKVLNTIGFFRSLQPISVEDLASKMINEAIKIQEEKITTYKPENLRKG